MTNKLIEFRNKWDLKQSEAAVRLGVSLKTIYNNESGEASDSMLKRIEIANEEIRRERIQDLSGTIVKAGSELSQLTST